MVVLIGSDNSLANDVGDMLVLLYETEAIQKFNEINDAVSSYSKEVIDLIFLCQEATISQIKMLVDLAPVMLICNGETLSNPIRHLIKSGLNGILDKDSLHELIKGIKSIGNHNHFICRKMLYHMIGEIHHSEMNHSLSKREVEILELLSRGRTYLEISNKCFISFDTTKSHVYNIYKKLDAKNKSEAVYKAREQRILF